MQKGKELWRDRAREPPLASVVCLTLANIIGIVTGALASASLKIVNDRKANAPILLNDPSASLNAASFLGVGGATIAAGAIAGTTTGLVNLFLVFLPGLYRKPIILALMVSSVFLFATVLAATIVIATGHASLTAGNTSQSIIAQHENMLGLASTYASLGLAKAFVITGWLSTTLTAASTLLVWRATRGWNGSRILGKSRAQNGDIQMKGQTQLTDQERAHT